MRQVELPNQPIQGARLFERVQVLALDVLDKRHGDRVVVTHLTNNGGNIANPGNLCRSPTPFAGNDFITL